MLRLIATAVVGFVVALFGSGLLIAVLVNLVGHTQTGVLLALGSELALWSLCGLAVVRAVSGAKATVPRAWAVIVAWSGASIITAVPLFISTLLAFDH